MERAKCFAVVLAYGLLHLLYICVSVLVKTVSLLEDTTSGAISIDRTPLNVSL